MKITARLFVLSAVVTSGFAIVPRDASAVTATIPGTFSAACGAGCLKVTNTVAAPGLYGIGTPGVQGDGTGGLGVLGKGNTGVEGDSSLSTGTGVLGLNFGTGSDTFPGAGVMGQAPNNYGVWGVSTNSRGVFGTTQGAWPAAGVYAEHTAANGTAMIAIADQPNSAGLFARGTQWGMYGLSEVANGIGTAGYANGANGHAIDATCAGSCATGGGYAGYFSGNVWVTGNISYASFTNRSDARLKKDVKEITSGLDRLLKLRPVTYRWKDESLGSGTQIGLIAQDVREVFPELVQEDRTSGMLSVNYTALVPVAIRGLQEQQAVINGLEARLARLERGQSLLASLFSDHLGAAAVVCFLPLGLIASAWRKRRSSR